MTSHLKQISELGQAVWLDNLHRGLFDDGELQRLVDEDGLSGVTSNPTIFEKAMGAGDRYDEPLQRAAERTSDAREVFFDVAYADVRDAADVLRPVFERTDGQDGYVSFELQPEVSYDVEGTIAEARRHREAIDRENVLIKVPGTPEGVRAFEELTFQGHAINVTLLFSVERYEEIAEAYVRGLERRAEAGEPINRVASVASFFIARVDGKIDAALEEAGRSDLKGRAAVANAKIAYEAFGRIFSGERWEKLAAKGANVQRPLWASTSPKDPSYSATLYVDSLIGPDTVNTMPDATLAAAREQATPEVTIDQGVEEAHALIREVKDAGVDVDDIVLHQLEADGVAGFTKSFDGLIGTIERKLAELAPAA